MNVGAALAEYAEALYGAEPERFTQTRTRIEKDLRARGDKEIAARVRGLRKPTVGAWAVNLLVRWEADQIGEVFALAGQLQSAATALDGVELRALTRQRRQLTAALTTRARQLALEHGQRLTQSVAEQVENTLNAAMLDDGVASAVRSGLMVTTTSATGVDDIDAARLVAYPEALGSVAPKAAQSQRVLHAVPDNSAAKRAAAEEELSAARAAAESAQAEHRQRSERLQSAQAELLQRRASVDQLQRQLADAEAVLESTVADVEVATDAVAAADRQARRAQEAVAAAAARLAQLN